MERKDGTGALFINDRRTNNNAPEYKGSIMINGVEYWLSAWLKQGQKGKYLSLAAQPKEQRDTVRIPKPPLNRVNVPQDLNDDLDIPF